MWRACWPLIRGRCWGGVPQRWVRVGERIPPSVQPTHHLARSVRRPNIDGQAACRPQRWMHAERSPPASTWYEHILPGLPVGLAAGFGGACAGVGGAVFIIPGLMRFAQMHQRVAQGTALLAACGTSVAGAYHYYQARQVDVSAALQLAVASSLLAPVGVALSQRLHAGTLRKGFGLFLIGVSPILPLRNLWAASAAAPSIGGGHPSSAKRGDEDASAIAAAAAESPSPSSPASAPLSASLISIGGLVGLLSGLLGVTGGTLFTPTLAVFYATRQAMHEREAPDEPSPAPAGMHTVIGTSMLAMLLPAAVAGTTYARRGLVNLRMLPSVLAGTLLGATIGSRVALHADETLLRIGFAAVFVALGARMWRSPSVG